MAPSIWQLLIILLIVVLLFGTKRLKSIGSDLGGALKGFRKSMSDDSPESLEKTDSDDTRQEQTENPATENTAKEKQDDK